MWDVRDLSITPRPARGAKGPRAGGRGAGRRRDRDRGSEPPDGPARVNKFELETREGVKSLPFKTGNCLPVLSTSRGCLGKCRGSSTPTPLPGSTPRLISHVPNPDPLNPKIDTPDSSSTRLSERQDPETEARTHLTQHARVTSKVPHTSKKSK